MLSTSVSEFNNVKLAWPNILKLIEYRPVIVTIPANKAGIFNFECKKPVIKPARLPATKAISVASQAGRPATIIALATAAPKGQLPSTVKSATSRIRYVKYTPIASIDHNKPCEILDNIKSTPFPQFFY